MQTVTELMAHPVEKFFACIADHDVSGALRLVDDATVFEAQGPKTVPIYGRFEGKAGVERFLATLLQMFDTEAFELRKWLVGDGFVFGYGYLRHRVRKTGKTFESEWALVCQVKGDLITYYKMFEDTAALQLAYEQDPPHVAEQTQTEPRVRTGAKAKITVQSYQARHYDQSASPELVELRLTEAFTGDIEGSSPVRALQVRRDDKSACQVSMQRLQGKLGGRQGTFVLQGSEIVENGKITARWFVVPGSATGELAGLRGEGGFEGGFGKGSDGTLNYWFE